MVIRRIENFLEAFEKKFQPKNVILSEYSNPILSFIFSKFELFALFLTYNQTGDKSGAEAPGPSGFLISFNEFTNVFISAFIK